jgi:hypothetical protein
LDSQTPPTYTPKNLPPTESFEAVPKGRITAFGPVIGPCSIVTRLETLQLGDGQVAYVVQDAEGFLEPIAEGDFSDRYDIVDGTQKPAPESEPDF